MLFGDHLTVSYVPLILGQDLLQNRQYRAVKKKNFINKNIVASICKTINYVFG